MKTADIKYRIGILESRLNAFTLRAPLRYKVAVTTELASK